MNQHSNNFSVYSDPRNTAIEVIMDRARGTDAYKAARRTIVQRTVAAWAECQSETAEATRANFRAKGGTRAMLLAIIAEEAPSDSVGSRMVRMTIADVLRLDVAEMDAEARHICWTTMRAAKAVLS